MNQTEVDTTKESLDSAIQRLQNIKEGLTVENSGRYNIQINQERKLEPIHQGFSAIGFEQVSGDVFSITIEDNARKGKVLV